MPASLDLRATRFVRALALSACAASACRPQRREAPPPPPIVDAQSSLEPVAVEDVPTDVSAVVEPAVVAVADAGSTLRSDDCPVEQPGEGARCSARKYCIYPQHAMQGTSCHCLLGDEARSNGEAPARWHCGPYRFVGVGPLPPPALDA